MNTVWLTSYLTGSIFFFSLTFILFTGKVGHTGKKILKIACAISVIWLALSALSVYQGTTFLPYLLEPARSFSWLYFLSYVLISSVTDKEVAKKRFRKSVSMLAAFSVFLCLIVIYSLFYGIYSVKIYGVSLLVAGFIVMPIVGLVLIEQIMRNAHVESRRAVKYLCIGLGLIFVYDFVFYSEALLFQRLDSTLGGMRGFVNALAVPVIGISIARDPRLSLDIFVSRQMVFHTTALFSAGIYLLAMGLGGYYIRVFGGEWGIVIQTIFLAGAGLLLMVLVFSGRLRANIKVLLNKHFFHYKYDYREEWLRFIQTLSSGQPDYHLRERAIHSIAEIIDSPAGTLWMRHAGDQFVPVTSWQMEVDPECKIKADHPLIRFMESREWLIDLDEHGREPELYNYLEIPGWLSLMPRAWLVVPLIVHRHMLGFIVLVRSPAQHNFNWEDSDLIKIAGKQVAVHLAQLETSQALAESRQFEATNRLTSYVMHDLKNLIAQLSLVVSNASKHRANPKFMEDAITTVDNSVQKMNRLLAHLRSDPKSSPEDDVVEMCGLLGDVVKTMSNGRPIPSLDCQAEGILIVANEDRLAAVIGHLIRNSQDATPDSGAITVRLFKRGNHAIVEVQDTGEGMDEEFIKNRLFRPFDSTKGSTGMGIGVYEARDYIHKLGGDVDVISRLQEGTTFRLQFLVSDANQNNVKLIHEEEI